MYDDDEYNKDLTAENVKGRRIISDITDPPANGKFWRLQGSTSCGW